MNIRLVTLLGVLLARSLVSAQEKQTFVSLVELPWRYVIGGYANGQWLNSEAAGKRLSASKMSYRVFTLTGEAGRVSAGKSAPDVDVCPDVWMQKLTPEPDLEKPALGVNAPWNPMPRKARATDTTQEVYVNAVRDLLVSKGISRPQVKITQVLRVDLEGDGEDEVLLSATRYTNAAEIFVPRAGDYSFVALRRVVAGAVRTQIVAGEFYPKANDDAASNTFEVTGLLDLDGDGTLEVVTRSTYYEGSGTEVWQLQKDKLMRVLAIDCGV